MDLGAAPSCRAAASAGGSELTPLSLEHPSGHHGSRPSALYHPQGPSEHTPHSFQGWGKRGALIFSGVWDSKASPSQAGPYGPGLQFRELRQGTEQGCGRECKLDALGGMAGSKISETTGVTIGSSRDCGKVWRMCPLKAFALKLKKKQKKKNSTLGL